MAQAYTPKIVTANALLEGDVVYLTADDQWTRALNEAELIEDEAHAQIRLLDAEMQPDQVIGPYLADAQPDATGLRPTHFREGFRATGPSNYAHAKQADLTHV